jgi:hypothetical protein
MMRHMVATVGEIAPGSKLATVKGRGIADTL